MGRLKSPAGAPSHLVLFREFLLQFSHFRLVLSVIDDSVDLFSQGVGDLRVGLEIFRIGRSSGSRLVLVEMIHGSVQFVARSFASEVTRSIASCCHALATERCDCRPRVFSCSLFTSSLMRLRTAAWEAQLGPLADEKDCSSAAFFLIFAMIGFAASSCAVTLGLSVAACACDPAGKVADASQRTPESDP
jgi:hypothetical protein